MLFTSITYICFFVLVLALYYLLGHKYRWMLLLLASYVYYSFGEPAYALLLLGFTGFHYILSFLIYQAQGKRLKKLYLWVSVVGSLATLSYFKYHQFLAVGLLNLFSWMGLPIDVGSGPVPDSFLKDVILPIGISFYAFQTMSYTIDVFYGKMAPIRHFGMFALFVSFFPQLINGPVERAKDLLPQFGNPVSFDYSKVVSGLRLILWGFFKKIAIADSLAENLNPVYSDISAHNGTTLFIAFVVFPIQLYADFSGYIDIARGCSRMLGIHLSRNFDLPFFARSVTDFWRRWNITISTWFRDYIFYPLYLMVKRRKALAAYSVKTVHNISFITSLTVMFLLLGLWHGAYWQFILLGLLQALFIVMETYIKVFPVKNNHPILVSIQLLKTYFLFCVLGLLFRSASVAQAWQHISGIFTGMEGSYFQLSNDTDMLIILLSIGLMLAVELFNRSYGFKVLLPERYMPLRWAFYLMLLAIISYTGLFHKSAEFVYMRF